MRAKRWLCLSACFVLLAFGSSSTALGAKDEIIIARSISTSAMDPGFLREAATIVDNIFDTLVLRDKDMKLVPGLATSWKSVNDTTWEFKLRQGVKFHNGEPFNASAVKFTIDRVLDPEAKSPTISYIRTIKKVDVVDEYTVNIVTEKPDPLIPTRMSRYPAYVVPPGYIAKVGKDEFAKNPIGTGPYKFKEWVKDAHITLVANEEYWRGKPAIKKVVWRPIPEDSARTAALLAGEVDIIETLSVDQVKLLEKNPQIRVDQVRYGGLIVYLGLKTDQAPLNNKKVREALDYAIDRKNIAEKVLLGYGTAVGSQVGPYDFGFLKMEPRPYDPEKAKRLLAEAGFPNGFEIAMQGTRRYLKGGEVAQAVARQFEAIGVKVKLEIPEWTVYIQQVPAGKQAPIYMLAWGSTQTLDADAAIYAIYKSDEPYSTVKSPKMDDLLDKTRSTVDPVEREKLFHEIQKLAYEEVPCLTLYQQDTLYGMRSNVDWKGRADARVPVFDIRLK